jgi:tetratricopeptide (TPR) repeat protein
MPSKYFINNLRIRDLVPFQYRNSIKFLMVVILLAFTDVSISKNIRFEREYIYQASEADSKLSCRAISLEQVKRLLLEELGTYLESHVEVRNSQLTKDEIITLSAGVVQTKIISEEWDGKVYRLKAEIEADPDVVHKLILQLRNEHDQTKKLAESQTKILELTSKINYLNEQINSNNSTPTILAEYQLNIQHLSGIQHYQNGIILGNSGETLGALREFDQAIDLYPDWNPPNSYCARALVYLAIGNFQEANSDCNRALIILPNYWLAYAARALISGFEQNFNNGLFFIKKALENSPPEAKFVVYYLQGILYSKLGDINNATNSYNLSINDNPNFSKSYFERGNLHWDQGNYSQSVLDLKIAANLGHLEAQKTLGSLGLNW